MPGKIDFHAHLKRDWEDGIEAHVERDLASGVERVVIFSHDNEAVLRAAERFPDHYIPFYWVDWEKDTVDTAAERRAQGFFGGKLINPPANYDDDRFFPIYEGLAEANMIALFHSALSSRSRPVRFQRIVKTFPELIVVGAHIGNPWYSEAAVLLYWSKNLYFDTSTSQLTYERPDHVKVGPAMGVKPVIRDLWNSGELRPGQLIYGSDQFIPEPGRSVNDYAIERHEAAFDDLDAPDDIRRRIYRENALGILRSAGYDIV